MWRETFKICNDHLDRRRHSTNTAKWAMQEFPHRLFPRIRPKYLSYSLGVHWAIFWCILGCTQCRLWLAMHPHQFQMRHTMLRWWCFDSMCVAPWKIVSASTNPNWRRLQLDCYYWICCFSSRVDHRHRSIGTIKRKKWSKLKSTNSRMPSLAGGVNWALTFVWNTSKTVVLVSLTL